MKKVLVVIMLLMLVTAFAVSAFAIESIAVIFEDANGKTVRGDAQSIFQMKRTEGKYKEFEDGTAIAVTFKSKDLPYLNLRSKTAPFNNKDNVWLFMAPSKVEENVAYFNFEDVKNFYLEGTCQNSGKSITDLESDFQSFLEKSCDWLGIYTCNTPNNTLTVTRIEIVKLDIVEPTPIETQGKDTKAFTGAIYMNEEYHFMTGLKSGRRIVLTFPHEFGISDKCACGYEAGTEEILTEK